MGTHWDHQSYYEILEVSPDAHESEIRVAYHRAMQTYSQDNPALLSVFTKDETAQLLQLIDEAYSILSSPTSRRAYDQKLSREQGDKVPRHAADHFISNSLTELSSDSDAFPEFAFDEEPAPSNRPPKPPPTKKTPSQHREAPIETHPSSHRGKTALSTFKIDPAMEETIELEQSFHGDFLRVVREYKNIDLDQVSDHTRIGKYYLKALETEDFERLPAPVFVRGFLVQIAKIYGLDEAKLCSSYLGRLKAHKDS